MWLYLLCSEWVSVLHRMWWNPKWFSLVIITLIESRSGLIRSFLSRNICALMCALALVHARTRTHTHTHTREVSWFKTNYKCQERSKDQAELQAWELSTQYVCWVYGFDEACLFSSQDIPYRCWGCLSWRGRARPFNCVGVKQRRAKVMGKMQPWQPREHAVCFLWHLLIGD